MSDKPIFWFKIAQNEHDSIAIDGVCACKSQLLRSQPGQIRKQIVSGIRNKNRYLVAFLGSRPIGYSRFHFSPDRSLIETESLIIPGFERQGFGTQLVKRLIRLARTFRCHQIIRRVQSPDQMRHIVRIKQRLSRVKISLDEPAKEVTLSLGPPKKRRPASQHRRK